MNAVQSTSHTTYILIQILLGTYTSSDILIKYLPNSLGCNQRNAQVRCQLFQCTLVNLITMLCTTTMRPWYTNII